MRKFETDWAIGTLVRVMCGSLQGVEGVVLATRDEHRLLIEPRDFGSSIFVVISSDQVEVS